MTREEFLEELRVALQGKISQAQVNEQLNYYENYIMEESRKGNAEEYVIENLGNPRLIAKTIIDMNQCGDEKGTNKKVGSSDSNQKNGVVKIQKYIMVMVLIVIFFLIAKIALFLIPIFIPIFLVVILLYLLFYGNRK